MGVKPSSDPQVALTLLGTLARYGRAPLRRFVDMFIANLRITLTSTLLSVITFGCQALKISASHFGTTPVRIYAISFNSTSQQNPELRRKIIFLHGPIVYTSQEGGIPHSVEEPCQNQLEGRE
jgi:hypothetical protein